MKKLALFLLLLCISSPLYALEEILSFHSLVEVQTNGDLIVTETIKVRAEGNDIKRGIYRDFPTIYQGKYGLQSEVPFEVLSVLRDRKNELWHQEQQRHGMRVYFGQEGVLLDAGEYTYQFRYRTGQQLGFFENHDELYWNVTGNGWIFSIQHATAEVVLPSQITIKSSEAYTGPSGAQGHDYVVEKSGSRALFQTTHPLAPKEGLTVVVTWEKGFIMPPTTTQLWTAIAKSNTGIFFGLIGLAIVFCYYSIAWSAYGRDPKRGIIIPRYDAPEGMSPAAVRYLYGLGKFDNTSLAATIINLAVLGALKIQGGNESHYKIERSSSCPNLSDDNAAVYNGLLGDQDSITFINKNRTTFQNTNLALWKVLRQQCDKVYFRRNTLLWILGLLLTLAPLGISIFNAQEIPLAIFIMVWLSIWSLGVLALLIAIGTQWQKSGQSKWLALPLTLFAIPFLIGWIFGVGVLIYATSLWVCCIYLAGIFMVIFFQRLLKQPTAEGRRKLDEIEGFRHYLSVAEEERLNLENPPERTPELFEKFLPYALALGVEQDWSQQFADILAKAQYQPTWYSGNHLHHFQAASFATGLGSSLTSSIASSSRSPGSSSGSGGGGSSGGGGGGGGGGGW